MKLFIQIPCFNEQSTITQTILDLPKSIDQIDEIHVLIIDDGCTDRTVAIAKDIGVSHILSLGSNRGLATAFKRGLEYCIAHGADIVVNTDGDNQYLGSDIKHLVQPILHNKADLVVGCRPIANHPEFSPVKKLLQFAGSWVLRKVSKSTVRDAASGFRAFSRETCLRLSIYSSFSYTMETLIQAGNSGLRIKSVDISVNRATRPSRLFRSVDSFLFKSGQTILLMFLLYRPGKFFSLAATVPLLAAFFIGLRYVILTALAVDPSRTYIPSLIFFLFLTFSSLFLFLLGLLGELLKINRQISQDILYHNRVRNNYESPHIL